LLNAFKKDVTLENKNVHAIGITSMYLASKYEDIYPLHSKIVSDKIAHKAFSSSEILKKETDFLNLFDY
jgi:cyclin B